MWTAIAGPIIDIVGKVLEQALGNTAEAAKIKAEVTQQILANERALAEAGRDVVVAEATGESWMQRNWRPSLMFGCMGFLACNAFIFPLINVIYGVDLIKMQQWEKIPDQLWVLLTFGMGGYIGARSAEKIISSIYRK